MTRELVCPVCDGGAIEREAPLLVSVGRREVEVECAHCYCEDCGETFFLPGQMTAAQERASQAIRRDEELLQGEEIAALRVRFGMTQEQLERLIGAGPKTVTRWERDKVFQGSTTDTLLRVLRRFPSVVAWLARERGVDVALANASAGEVLTIVALNTAPFQQSRAAQGRSEGRWSMSLPGGEYGGGPATITIMGSYRFGSRAPFLSGMEVGGDKA